MSESERELACLEIRLVRRCVFFFYVYVYCFFPRFLETGAILGGGGGKANQIFARNQFSLARLRDSVKVHMTPMSAVVLITD